ncbi:MAG: TRAM domain-containing protein [Bdellovibrionota bacterium]
MKFPTAQLFCFKHNNKKIGEKKDSELLGDKETVNAYTISTNANGIAKLEDGSIVFVENLLPGETAVVKIHTQKSSYKRASVINRETDSTHRDTPPCIYYSTCGGCQIQHIKQEKQIDYKIQWFFETLKRIGKWDSEFIAIAEKKISIIFFKTSFYRRRIRLHFNGKNLGFRAAESHNIINIDSCFIARPKLNEKISYLKNKLISIYPELQKTFSPKQLEFDIEITESDDNKILLNFVHVEPNLKLILHKYFEIQEDQLIHIKHPILGKFKLKKESFVQPHFDAIESYYEHISSCINSFLRTLKGSNIQAWDLYSGCGIFSSIPYFNAQKFGFVSHCLAVEGIKESIDSLKLNYKNFPIEGLVQDVHEFIENQFSLMTDLKNSPSKKSFVKPNIVILDPPRSGVGIPNMQKIVELCAQESCVLYLACDPASFARDTRILLEGGFHCKQIFLFDSFGQTNFYEVLGFFSRGL